MSYRFVDSFRAGPSWSCSKAVCKPVWQTPVPSVQWINSWWCTEELPETCRVLCRSKLGKLVHLVGFIIKKFVTMHGHMNIKKVQFCLEIWNVSTPDKLYFFPGPGQIFQVSYIYQNHKVLSLSVILHSRNKSAKNCAPETWRNTSCCDGKHGECLVHSK
jgi:hypothetical protein